MPILYLQGEGVGILVELDLASPNSGRLAYFGSDCAGVFTGATYGVTEVVTERLDGPPDDDLDDWETVEEASIETSSELRLVPHPAADVQTLEALAATAIGIPDTKPGTYRVRVSARGRDVHRSDVTVRVQVWATSEIGGLRVIKTGDEFDPRSLTSVTPRRHERDETPAARPTMTSGDIAVSYHAFLISGLDTDPTETYTRGSVFEAGNDLISVRTGIASGPATVTVERFEGDPILETGVPPIDESQWESIDEVTIPCRTEMWFITLDGEVLDLFGSFSGSRIGTRTFRIAARGRAENWDMIVDEPTEHYLIQTWGSQGGPSMITRMKWTDGVWDD